MDNFLEFLPMEAIESKPSPRLILTHLPFDFLPKKILEKRSKIIRITRNPKDVACSFYNHTRWGELWRLYLMITGPFRLIIWWPDNYLIIKLCNHVTEITMNQTQLLLSFHSVCSAPAMMRFARSNIRICVIIVRMTRAQLPSLIPSLSFPERSRPTTSLLPSPSFLTTSCLVK